MDTMQFVTLIVTILAGIGTMLFGFGMIYREIKTLEKDLRDDIKIQSARSDQLYTMFVDLLKLKKGH